MGSKSRLTVVASALTRAQKIMEALSYLEPTFSFIGRKEKIKR